MRGPAPQPSIGAIVPALHEPSLADRLERLCAEHNPAELIVVHAGDPATYRPLQAWIDAHAPANVTVQLLQAARGRATQMNHGAAVASSDVLLFLHADTELPPGAFDAIRRCIVAGAVWGRFDVRLSGGHFLFRIIERFMNWRSALTGIATGDQAMFVRADAFRLLDGFAPIELMEDVELSMRLKWLGRPARIRATAFTSSRRWETRGIVRTVLHMWALRALYACGVAPRRLAAWYR